jgi:hypothetical protein
MVFDATLWIVSSSSYIFHPSLVIKIVHLGVQTRARRSTVIRRLYLSVCRLQNVSVVQCSYYTVTIFVFQLLLLILIL